MKCYTWNELGVHNGIQLDMIRRPTKPAALGIYLASRVYFLLHFSRPPFVQQTSEHGTILDAFPVPTNIGAISAEKSRAKDRYIISEPKLSGAEDSRVLVRAHTRLLRSPASNYPPPDDVLGARHWSGSSIELGRATDRQEDPVLDQSYCFVDSLHVLHPGSCLVMAFPDWYESRLFLYYDGDRLESMTEAEGRTTELEVERHAP